MKQSPIVLRYLRHHHRLDTLRDLPDIFQRPFPRVIDIWEDVDGRKSHVYFCQQRLSLLEAGKNSQRHQADGLIGRTRVVAAGSARTHAFSRVLFRRRIVQRS
jgi:hypothetical protein